MLEWQYFHEKVFSQKPNISSELISLNHENQIGIFFQKNDTTLYFGFLIWSDDASLNELIILLEQFAKLKKMNKIVGPIDGATWNNYRFQYKIEILKPYSGQPKYSRKACDIFLNQAYQISEKYHTVEIKKLELVKKQLSQFEGIIIDNLTFVQPTAHILTNHKDQFQNILNQTFKDNHAYSEISSEENIRIFQFVKENISYQYSVLALNSENQIVGFMLNYTSGSTLFIKTIGFLPEYRNQGLSVFKMLNYLFQNLNSEIHIESAILCLMRKNNFPSLLSNEIHCSENEYVLLEKLI
jgi:hypothetical protein